MSSENYTLEANNYTVSDKILLLKAAIFDAQEMMAEITDELEQGRLRHAARVLRKELWYQRHMLNEISCAESSLAQ